MVSNFAKKLKEQFNTVKENMSKNNKQENVNSQNTNNKVNSISKAIVPTVQSTANEFKNFLANKIQTQNNNTNERRFDQYSVRNNSNKNYTIGLTSNNTRNTNVPTKELTEEQKQYLLKKYGNRSSDKIDDATKAKYNEIVKKNAPIREQVNNENIKELTKSKNILTGQEKIREKNNLDRLKEDSKRVGDIFANSIPVALDSTVKGAGRVEENLTRYSSDIMTRLLSGNMFKKGSGEDGTLVATDLMGEDKEEAEKTLQAIIDIVGENAKATELNDPFGRNYIGGINRIRKNTGIEKFVEQNKENIDKQQQRMDTKIGKNIGEITPSLTKNGINMLLNLVNPVAGSVFFSSSAFSDYYDEALQKGMSLMESLQFGTAMSLFETATEELITFSNIKGFDQWINNDVGISRLVIGKLANVGENAAQEGIMEPLGRITENYARGNKIFDGLDNPELWNNALKEAAMGAESAIILDGMGMGISSCLKFSNKVANGQQPTMQEFLQASQDSIDAGVNADKYIEESLNKALSKIQKSFENTEPSNKLQEILNDANESGMNKETIKEYLANKVEQNRIDEQEQYSLNDSIEQTTNEVETNLNETVRESAERIKDLFNSEEDKNRVVSTMEKFIELRNKHNTNGTLNILFNDKVNGNGKIIMNENGNRTILINPKSNKSFEFILSHELVHDIRNTKHYQGLQDIVLKFAQKSADFQEGVEQLTKEYTDFYKQNGYDINKLDINEEVTADVVGTLLGDQNFINQLSIEKPSIFQRIRNWINQQIEIHKSGDKEATKFLYDVKNKFEKALRSQNKNSQDSEKYRVLYDKNNNPYVKVENDILENIPKKDWIKTVKEVFKQKYPNGIDMGFFNIGINAKSKNEFISSKYSQYLKDNDIDLYKSKFMMTDNIDEIVQNAYGVKNEPLKHKRSDSLKSFNHANIDVEIGSKFYNVEVVTGINTKNKELFYDIVNIHENKNRNTSISYSANAVTNKRKCF